MADCIVCGSSGASVIAELPSLPVDTNRLWRSREEARTAVKAPMALAHCSECGHTYNSAYVEGLVDYAEEYENSQMFSPRFQAYAQALCDRLAETHALRGKRIVEVGGGRGEFLGILCDRAGATGVSFGPSYKPGPNDEVPPNVGFITDYYTEKYADEPADLIVCRHVLEHFWEPRELVTTVRRAVADRGDLVVYFEVPNGEYMFREQLVWEVIYTHPSYFSKRSLARLFRDAGFHVIDVREAFDGQFLTIEACAAPPTNATQADTDGADGLSTAAHRFGESFDRRIGDWRARMRALAERDRRPIAWGAGAKAVTFLNCVDGDSQVVSQVVDLNPRKADRFIAGSGQRIVRPEAALELHPDVVIMMNAVYQDEISRSVHTMGLDPDLTVA